ncbi:MAG: PepSY-like domain-containing protein [Candidatus Azobacteroides sp.]|nr:PepSY-like domain-containing protein [Candidatus Azobacteroides sp.]
MKKNVFFILLSFITIQFIHAKDVITQDESKLPVTAMNFIKTHFPNEKISYIKVDEEYLTTSYDVVFTNGMELEFEKNGEWKEVNTKRAAVPAAIIPSFIQQYVKTHYSNAYIYKIERKRSGDYEVELSNDLELRFNKDGKLIKIDD